MKILLAFAALLCFIDAHACEFQFPTTITIPTSASAWNLVQKNCSETQKHQMIELLTGHSGIIPLERLRASLGNDILISSGSKSVELKREEATTQTAYRLLRAMPAFSSFDRASLIEEVQVPENAFSRYFTDPEKLKYYRTNKPLRAGEILREADIVPTTLVRAGDRVELLIDSATVRIRSHALSRQNGGIGDSVEVWNQQSGKKHYGTITGPGKVTVDL